MARIDGLDKWARWKDKRLQALDGRIKREVKKHGGLVERDAKRLSAVDTGVLRRSIQSEIKDGGYTAEISAMAINPVNNFDYAIANEHGTVKMQAQPFMTPAFENAAPKFKKALEKTLTELGG